MRQDNRYEKWLALLLCVAGLLLAVDAGALAQSATPQAGDPPVASLISVSPADEDGIVTISGGAGSVFPVAQVAIRNLYTEQTVYTNAGIQGTFSARIFGPGNTPFYISPAPQIPNDLRDVPGSLPGGPGTIVYDTQPEARAEVVPVTELLLDASLDDWAAYPEATMTDSFFALLNRDSLLIGSRDPLPEDALLVVQVTLNGTTYDIALNPRLPQAAILTQIAPSQRDLGTLAVASAIRADGVVEARIPVAGLIGAELTEAVLNTIVFRGSEGEELAATVIGQVLTQRDERDGIVYPGGATNGGVIRFSTAGPLAQGAAVWTAAGRVNGVEFAPGDALLLEMDVTIDAPDFPESLVGLSLIGDIYLQPVAVDTDGDGSAEQNIAARLSNNGWSNLLTQSGLARDNVSGDLLLGRVIVPSGQIVRRDGRLLAGMRFDLTLPGDLPPGLYVPVFAGFAQVGDGDVFSWRDNGVFGTGPGISDNLFSRLPLVLNVGGIETARQPWALFMAHPSDGARGLLPEEDAGRIALSTRVKTPPQTYILPPGMYPLEPYLPGQLPNSATITAAPLMPLLFPGGRLNVVVNRPDGMMDELSSVAIVQNVIGTDALDEATRYGSRNLVDFYRLATLNPAVNAYHFDAYGAYEIELTGNVEDVRGNRYNGGGTYRLLVAESLDLLPGVLPGTPFEVGDALYAGATLLPGVPAEMTVTLTLYPLGGGDPVRWEIEGDANATGIFNPAESFTFETAGEYVIDYEARYTTSEGILYAASLRSVGVVATPDTALIAHGQRGIEGYTTYRPAWFDAASYPPDALEDVPGASSFYFPYFSGDIAVIADDNTSGLTPALRIQDTGGAYADWLAGTLPDYVSTFGDGIERLRVEGSLPLIPVLGGPPTPFGAALVPDFISNEAYGYVSAVRPGISARQFVLGGEYGGLDLGWDTSDRYNDQIGAGETGDRPGDVFFLFGGAVIRNAESGVNDAAIYASMAVVGDEGTVGGVYPPYRGAAGGADGGPLLTVGGEAYTAILQATGAGPGQTYTTGEALRFAGQVGPTVESEVQITLTAPDGTQTQFVIPTNAIGYFFDPQATVTLDQAGVWSVRMTAIPTGATSVGTLEAPLPVATIPGTPDGVFDITVLPRSSEPLTYNDVTGSINAEVNPGIPFNFSETVPQGWTDTVAYRTVMIPGYVLETGAFPLTGRSAIYTYSPATLARDFPMLEFEGRGEGPSASDVVTLTFTLAGLDETGQPVIQSRTFHILHDRLVSFVGD